MIYIHARILPWFSAMIGDVACYSGCKKPALTNAYPDDWRAIQ